MEKQRRLTLFVILSLFVFSGLAQAADEATPEKEESEPVVMKEVVVTATRYEEEISTVPANVTVIDEEDIENSNAKNVPDLLSTEEGIVVRDLLGNGKTAQVDLRGYGETAPYNTLVLVDGRRVNEIDLSGVDWTQIPLEQIERIEIVRGTGTVLYGDNASGGVINIITKTPSDKFRFKAGALVGSYSRNKEEVSISGGHGNIAALLSGSYDSTNGYRENNEFRAMDVGGKIVYDPSEFLSLNLSGGYHSDDYGLPGELSEEQVAIDRRAANNPFDEAESKDGYLKLLGDLDLGRYGSIVTDLSYRDRKIASQFVSYSSASNSEIKTWGITPRYLWRGDIFNRPNTLIAGVDVYLADQDGKSFFGSPLALSGLADVERDAYGFYVNDEISLLGNLILSVGARHQRVQYDLKQEDLLFGFAPLDDTVTHRENAYNAGLNFLYRGKSSVFVRANRSFRFPLTEEIIVFDFETGQIQANPDLKPQTGTHYEVGANHYFT
ncbi:MAG: TonB-dependent receptor, partial [Deltaproteobacteria bacterium]|nr:TonB-dependent receptor [Deltaproteobacteria bacterium]